MNMAKAAVAPQDNAQLYSYWNKQISRALRNLEQFHKSGDIVVDKYRNERAGNAAALLQRTGGDKYNILYSSTETVRPSLYAQTPKVEVVQRHKDRSSDTVLGAVMILEAATGYAVDEVEFDEVITNCIEDFTLPGWGQAWVRYVPSFKDAKSETGDPLYDDEKKKVPTKELDYEAIGLDYIHWKDFLTGSCRTWAELPWGAKRIYKNKEEATEAFGADVASKLQYAMRDVANDRESGGLQSNEKQAVIWEVWDKRKKQVIWYSDGYTAGLLKVVDDPLRLKKFFPFPKPIRAVSNTKTIVPRSFYSQYQSQAEEIDNLTARIRHLTNALQVRGVFDGSMEELRNLLLPTGGNKMIPVNNWQQFVQNNGVVGSIQWVPIKDVAAVLMQLLQARDTAKAEIYEITGFSDILRGASKASETLGAQQIKQNWGGARLRVMQKEVQRFTRDIIRIMGEIVCEHFTVESLALYSGFDPEAYANDNPQPAPQAPPQQPGQPPVAPPPAPDPVQVAIAQFKKSCDLLKQEKERCAMIGIETDSTILPDEAEERKDRLEFVGQIGAFMQQAGPMAMQYPDMRSLLASIMMFAVRSFRSSRPLEQEFEKFQKSFENAPPVDPNKKEGDDGAAAAQATLQKAQIEAQSAQSVAQIQAATEKYKIDQEQATERAKNQQAHDIKMAELAIKAAELEIAKAELQLATADGAINAADSAHSRALSLSAQEYEQAQGAAQTAMDADQQQHDQAMDRVQNDQQQQQVDQQAQQAEAPPPAGENGA
jgi:hypothetical protein